MHFDAQANLHTQNNNKIEWRNLETGHMCKGNRHNHSFLKLNVEKRAKGGKNEKIQEKQTKLVRSRLCGCIGGNT